MTKFYAIGRPIQVIEQGFLNPFPGQGRHKIISDLDAICSLRQCGENIVVFSDFHLAVEYANLFSAENSLSKFSDYTYYPPVVEVTLLAEESKQLAKIKSPMQTREFEGFITTFNNLESITAYFYNSGWCKNPRHHHVTDRSYHAADIAKMLPGSLPSKCVIM